MFYGRSEDWVPKALTKLPEELREKIWLNHIPSKKMTASGLRIAQAHCRPGKLFEYCLGKNQGGEALLNLATERGFTLNLNKRLASDPEGLSVADVYDIILRQAGKACHTKMVLRLYESTVQSSLFFVFHRIMGQRKMMNAP